MNNNQQLPLLKCFVNGKCQTLSIEQAHQQLWQVNYGWVVPLNWFHWNIEGYQNGEFLLQRITPQPAWFALNIFLCQCPFTIDMAERIINDINREKCELNGREWKYKELDENVFVAWMSRFNKLFQHRNKGKDLPCYLWPFQFEPVFTRQNRVLRRPAYKKIFGRSYMVLMGVHPDFEDTSVLVEWNRFLEPPGK